MTIRVFIVDDHAIVRTGIRMILSAQVDIDVVGEADSGESALPLIRKLKPDVVLSDLHLPGASGLDLTERLVKLEVPPKVIVVSVLDDGPMPRRLLEAGASGYVGKGGDSQELVAAVRSVAQGKRYLANAVAQNIALAGLGMASSLETLSPRETEVALLLSQGLKNEEIARQLRLRNIAGVIIVDFIDMVLESNRDLVQRRLMECLSRDRTKHQVAEVTSLGLVQMTRKKLGIGLLEAFSEPCEACASRGVIVHHEPIMRSKHSAPDDQKPQQNQGGNKKKNRDRNQKQETVKVVTAERAVEINNVMTQIAASTVAAHEAAGESSPITLPAAKLKGDSGANTNDAPAAEKMLEAVLDALPPVSVPSDEPKKYLSS